MSDNESIENGTEVEEDEGVEETKGNDEENEEPDEILVDELVDENPVEVEDVDTEGEYDDDELPENELDEDDVESQENERPEENNNEGGEKPSNIIQNNNGHQQADDSSESDTDESDSESEDEYIHKVDLEKKLQYIKETHTQEISKTYEEMVVLTKIKRQKTTNSGKDLIVDDKHTTVPILTKYEKTRVLGIRVSQLNEGAPRYISLGSEHTIIDNNVIAEKELRLKKLPFIVTRPLPNGEKEHWRLKDLEIL
jgi:DNA-directed RNA polymerase subunit K/omega